MVDLVESWLHTSPWLALAGVFFGGVLTAASPCVLATLPLMMAFVMGRREEAGPLRALGYSLLFVLGLAITFVGLGMAAALAGSLYGDVPGFLSWVVAAVCLVMGLHMLGAFTLPIPALSKAPQLTGALGALVLGLLFGFVSAPCAAPILIVLLTWLAGSNASVAWGGALLLAYALGHSVLVLVAGTSMGAARKLLASKRLQRATHVLHKVAGVVIIGVGAWYLLSH